MEIIGGALMGIRSLVSRITRKIKVKLEERKLKQLEHKAEQARLDTIRKAKIAEWEEKYKVEKQQHDEKLVIEKAKADARAKVFGDGRPSFMEKLNERREYVKARNRVERRSSRMAEPEQKRDVEGALKKLWG